MTDFSYANTSFTRNSRNRTRKSRRREKASRGSCTALRTTRDTDRSRVVPFPPLTLCICVCMHTERGARGEAWERARERPKVTTHVGGRSAFRTRTRKADGCLYTYRLILREKEPLRRGYTHIYIHVREIDSRYGYNERGRESERERCIHTGEARRRERERERSSLSDTWARAREASVGSWCTLGPDTAPTLHRASPSWTRRVCRVSCYERE